MLIVLIGEDCGSRCLVTIFFKIWEHIRVRFSRGGLSRSNATCFERAFRSKFLGDVKCTRSLRLKTCVSLLENTWHFVL